MVIAWVWLEEFLLHPLLEFVDHGSENQARTLVVYTLYNFARPVQLKDLARLCGVACYESGFQDIGYFYRVFKKYTGQTPGDFIANYSGAKALT